MAGSCECGNKHSGSIARRGIAIIFSIKTPLPRNDNDTGTHFLLNGTEIQVARRSFGVACSHNYSGDEEETRYTKATNRHRK